MDSTLLRSWLGLPPGPWPPDHHALLGLPPGPADPAAVEARVMDRMGRLRHHQLLHPDLVTEGMNRLAQALITLTDPAAATADMRLAAVEPVPPPVPPVQPEPVVVAEPVFDDDVFADDLGPADLPDPADATQLIVLPGAGEPPTPYELIDDPPAVRPARVIDAEIAPAAPPVSRRWVYARLALLRRAVRAWDRLGPVLGDPRDPVDRPGRALLLLEAVAAVRPLLPALRGVVGGVNEPGGMVAAVVGHPLVLDTLRRLLPDQRLAVAIDWRRGQGGLRREYDRLRGLSRAGRERPPGARGGLVVWRVLVRTPELVLAALALLALFVALVRTVAGR